MERVLNCARLVHGYPLPEFRLVPERVTECVYCYFVGYSADSGHDDLESFYEVAERFVFSLGHAPEIDIRSFPVYEHRVLLEEFRGELAKASDGISLQAR